MKRLSLLLLIASSSLFCSLAEINVLKEKIFALSLSIAQAKVTQKFTAGELKQENAVDYLLTKAPKIYVAIVLGEKEKYKEFHDQVNLVINLIVFNKYKEQYPQACEQETWWETAEYLEFAKKEIVQLYDFLLTMSSDDAQEER